jgi:hypothetical protein
MLHGEPLEGITAFRTRKGQSISPRTDEAKKKKVTKRLTPIVNSQVHRSERVKQGNNGFKPSECSNRKCTSCNPPTLSTKIIRSLALMI